jgi:hypothetical protein
MRSGVETEKVIAGAGDAAMRPQAPVTVVDGYGSAVIVGRACRRGHVRSGVAELIGVAMAGVCPSTDEARQTQRWFLI